jgi:hypothetical protein
MRPNYNSNRFLSTLALGNENLELRSQCSLGIDNWYSSCGNNNFYTNEKNARSIKPIRAGTKERGRKKKPIEEQSFQSFRETEQGAKVYTRNTKKIVPEWIPLHQNTEKYT